MTQPLQSKPKRRRSGKALTGYAATTKVPVSKSQEEIKRELRKLGANSIGVMEGERESMVVFIVNDVRYLIRTKMTDSDQQTLATWRRIGILVKAKAIAIAEGITTVEEEFLSHAVMPDGSTLADHSKKLIERSYQDGGPPRFLMLGKDD